MMTMSTNTVELLQGKRNTAHMDNIIGGIDEEVKPGGLDEGICGLAGEEEPDGIEEEKGIGGMNKEEEPSGIDGSIDALQKEAEPSGIDVEPGSIDKRIGSIDGRDKLGNINRK